MKTTARSQWTDLILILAVILGTAMRFNPTLLTGFPVGDGGMFAVMVEDLKASHYKLPAFTTYNHSNIPFAYPPLGFYLGRMAADIFRLPSPEALRWVPPLFASLSILAFYLLAVRLLSSKHHASYATLFFAMMPRALSWFISGGGLTRAPAQFFMLLTITAAVRLYQERRGRDVVWAGLFAGLTIMSHPEAAVHMVTAVILFWVMLGHSKNSFFMSLGVAALAVITSAPWWLTVIQYHGIMPLLSALQTGQKSAAILNLIFFNFTEEPYATLLAILGLIGFGYCVVYKNYLLPLWLLLPFLVEGRSAILPASMPLAMLASIGFVDVVLTSFLPNAYRATGERDHVPKVEFGILIYILLFLLFSTYQFGLQVSGNSLSIADREAMAWARENTPPDARFLVLTGTNAVTCDLTLEWFPALTDRQSLYTVQGTEWTKGADFIPYVQSTYAVQRCLTAGDRSCLDTVVKSSQYDYLYIDKLPRQNCQSVALPDAFYHFVESVRSAPGFSQIYESQDVVIFRK